MYDLKYIQDFYTKMLKADVFLYFESNSLYEEWVINVIAINMDVFLCVLA